jgi:hypothetical protein
MGRSAVAKVLLALFIAGASGVPASLADDLISSTIEFFDHMDIVPGHSIPEDQRWFDRNPLQTSGVQAPAGAPMESFYYDINQKPADLFGTSQSANSVVSSTPLPMKCDPISNTCRLVPPTGSQATTTTSRSPQSMGATQFIPPNGNTFGAPVVRTTPLNQLNPAKAPGGISFGLAAAMRMSLNVNLEGMRFNDGRLLLTGDEHGATIDAALLMTGLRLACSREAPYFSLDPVDGWSEDTQRAFERIGQYINRTVLETERQNFRRGELADGLKLQTFSVRRSFRDVWNAIVATSPHLKSSLVFRPSWLRETRFGDIMYRADLLLKELSTGVSVLDRSVGRPYAIKGYVSALERNAADAILMPHHPEEAGTRYWFDLASTDAIDRAIEPRRIPAGAESDLVQALARRGLLGTPSSLSKPIKVSYDGVSVDLSQVWPRIFVRRHDAARGVDVDARDFSSEAVALDVNGRPESYAREHTELRELAEVLRAYVGAVTFVSRDESICTYVEHMPMLPSERLDRALPDEHPSELAVAIISFVGKTREGRTFKPAYASIMSGGVAMNVTPVVNAAMSAPPTPTAVTRRLERQEPGGQRGSWQEQSTRYVSLVFEDIIPPVDLAYVHVDHAYAATDVFKMQQAIFENLKPHRAPVRLTASQMDRRRQLAGPNPIKLSTKDMERVAPYFLMVRDASGVSWPEALRFHHNWTTLLANDMIDQKMIEHLKLAGFKANVFSDGHRYVVAFGYDPTVPLTAETLDTLRGGAQLLVSAVKGLGYKPLLTGYNFGADMAATAARAENIQDVVLFNPSQTIRGPLASSWQIYVIGGLIRP